MEPDLSRQAGQSGLAAFIKDFFATHGDPPRKFDKLRKLLVILVGAFMISSIFYITAQKTQSAYRLYERDGSAVFIDKYVDAGMRKEILAGHSEATGDFLRKLGVDPDSGARPAAYFFNDRHYGVLNADDNLVRSRLDDMPSSDFSLFRTISMNLYANELVADSISSRDGSYIFVVANGGWKQAVLHGEMHAMAARNMPASMASVLNTDSAFSADTWFSYRFADEAVALLVSDLYALARESGDLDAAIASFAAAGAEKYSLDGGELIKKELEIWYATFNPPSKTTEFYIAANSFGSFLLERLGREGTFQLVRHFLTGDYAGLDDLFSAWGGFDGAMTAWKGDSAIPR